MNKRQTKIVAVTAALISLQALCCVCQPRECLDTQNYCHQSDICAYIFNYPSKENGSCGGMLDTIANMYYVEGSIELLQFHIRDINAQIATQNADMDLWQRQLDEQRRLREGQESGMSTLQSEMTTQLADFGHRLQEYEGELYTQKSLVESLQQTQSTAGHQGSGEIWELRSEVRQLHRRLEGQNQAIETQREMIFNLQNELLEMQISAGCNLEYNTDRPGGDMVGVLIEPKRSVVQCCIACKDTPGCRSFSYNEEDGQCSVKDNRPKKKRVEGYISGVLP